ncbi:uncharacterized protein LOC108113862 [Drosophila eugracilis]|uniref:uncharacterized protein LOC108113862 n=1 Tax=Drosophila eugracilis TaxID=29029 RepID=UPI001BD9D136|nr:uncharacterized protein LOC108113862 [Drosophila eugracilis]
MSLKVQSWLSLLLLAGCLSPIQGEEFPQCANAVLDTFVMAIDDCASYIYCNGEDSFRDSCPESTYFDDQTQECAFDDNGVCLGNSVSALTEAEGDQQTTEKEEGSDGTTPHPTPPAQFTPTTSSESSTAASDISTPSADSSPTLPTISPSSSTPKPSSPASERPHCDLTGDGVHPHPQRCEYFYRCLSGYLTIVRCPYKYGWDFPTMQCKPMAEAHCLSL